MSRHRSHRKDANHDQVQQDLEALGFYFGDCSQTDLGFDAFVAKAGWLKLLEIKDGTLSPSRRRLTPHEQQVHAALLRHGVRVELIQSRSDYDILDRSQRARREG